MKKLFVFAILLASMTAQANTYLCLGIDENGGSATVNGNPDPNKPLAPFGHVKGSEVRLIEDADGSLGLTIKKSDSDIISIVAKQGAVLFSEGNIDINCVLKQ